MQHELNYKVIVVEDEALIRRNIIKKIQALKIGFNVVGSAMDGKNLAAQAFAGQVEQLASMFGVNDISPLGAVLASSSNNTYGASTGDMNNWLNNLYMSTALLNGRPTAWATGGIANEPTWGVFGEAGPEAFLRLSDSSYAPVQLNGDSGDIVINLQVVTEDGDVRRADVIRIARSEADNVIALRAARGKSDSTRRYYAS